MIKYSIGKLVKKKGLSARGLAAKAGISPNTAALLIKAKSHEDYNVTADVIDRICYVLGCRVEDILEHKKEGAEGSSIS